MEKKMAGDIITITGDGAATSKTYFTGEVQMRLNGQNLKI